MAWTKPELNRATIRAAGELYISKSSSKLEPESEHGQQYYVAIGIILEWRSSHGFPLNTAQATLRKKARLLDSHAVVAQRLKRFVSIITKLRRFPTMGLDQMQDIGGCRAIVKDVGTVRRLEEGYRNNPRLSACTVAKKDYISMPKLDGYRSVHMVYKYSSSKSIATAPWNGLRVEIQLRTRLQHAWAAAVETVDLFTRQNIKTGRGTPEWARFMALMSSAIALDENAPLVPQTPTTRAELTEEIRHLHDHLNVSKVFERWSETVTYVGRIRQQADAFHLITIDLEQGIKVKSFQSSALKDALDEYGRIEAEISDRTDVQAVLAFAGSFDALEAAFPAYFNETRLFMVQVQRALSR